MAQDKAPQQMAMGDWNGASHPILSPFDEIFVKQTARGCLQECLGCEARSEFRVAGGGKNEMFQHITGMGRVNDAGYNTPNSLYILENSTCLQRNCCRDGRAMEIPVTAGGEPGGATVMTLKKDQSCCVIIPTPVGAMPNCGFCLPQVSLHKGGSENSFAEVKYHCDINIAVPKFKYFENGEYKYYVAPPSCCGGCCIDPECGSRGCNLIVPFYFHTATGIERITNGATEKKDYPQIAKVFGPLKKECCTTADYFMVRFPEGITDETKAGILGTSLFIDFLFFENQQEKQ
jgi:hypothetical protein